jgi:6-phosphogluconolactonase/glucosamine-6-phosphate isomerase/deaminase
VSHEGDFFDLVPTSAVPTPRLTGGVVHRPDLDALVDALLAEVSIHARNCVRAFGDFQFAISGTEETEPALRRLMYDLNHRDFPWARTRVWMVDEVFGPEEESRWARIRGLVLDQSGIPPEQVHRLRVTTPLAEGMSAYEAELRQHLGWREKGHDRLDLALLSLSPTGGVAGYEDFTHEEPDPQDARLVEGVAVAPVVGEPVVSMTMSFLNASRMVAVLASGEARREAVRRMVEAVRMRRRDRGVPALWLAPMAGELRFYVDNAACPGT